MLIVASLGLSALLALPLAASGCDAGSSGGSAGTGGGGGTPTPTNTNKVEASATGDAELHVTGTRPTAEPKVFGANIADGVLQLWMVGDDGTTVTAILDTTAAALPGEVPVGVPTQAASWVTVTVPTSGHVYNTFDGSGTVVVDQCPGAAGTAFTGSFHGIRLKDELQQGEIVLNGTFNLMVAAVSGPGLNCKAVAPEPDASSGTDTTTTGDAGPADPCPINTCDGPCCPFAQCISSCEFNCAMNTCMTDPMGCDTCMTGCYPGCDVSAACQTAADAVNQCSEKAGCDPMAEDDVCIKTHCCAELRAAM